MMSTLPPVAEGLTLEIVRRIQDGDREAWTELYRRHHDELLFAVRAQLGRRLRGFLESEDVLQSVALDAFQAMPRFEHRGPGSLKAFLHRLVVNKIRDRADTMNAKKRSGAVPLTDSLAGRLAGKDEPRYFDDERYDRLERCLERLPEDMRQVVVLRKIDGLSSKEAAEALGKSDAATRKLYSRALARLGTAMALEAEGSDGTDLPGTDAAPGSERRNEDG